MYLSVFIRLIARQNHIFGYKIAKDRYTVSLVIYILDNYVLNDFMYFLSL